MPPGLDARGRRPIRLPSACHCFCDIIILFGTICKSNTVWQKHFTIFLNFAIEIKNKKQMYNFSKSSKSRMWLFEPLRVACEPQFGHPCYIGLSLGPQDPRGPSGYCGKHKFNCRYMIKSINISQTLCFNYS